MRKFPTKPREVEQVNQKVECLHEWKRFKQTLMPQERTSQQVQMGLEWKGLGAHFTVKACTKCKKKIYLDYVVER